jgi:hypothetical protein
MDRQSHLDIAGRNETFLKTIDESAHGGWAVVVRFYAALHYVDAFLANTHAHPGAHAKRRKLVGAQLPQADTPYRMLQDASEDARYNGTQPSPAELATSKTSLSAVKVATGV